MTKRDRIVISVILSVGVLAALWFLALGPKRSESAKLDGKIAVQQQRLAVAQAGTASARDAKSRYESDYAAVARLGQAVPADENTPSLVYELDHAAGRSQIDFRSLQLEAAAGGAPAAAAPAPVAPAGNDQGTAPVAAPAAGATGAAGAAVPVIAPVTVGEFPTMPFSFELEGSFFHLESFLRRVARFTAVKGKRISVSGRLVSVTGIQIAASKKGFPRISATIKATAYQLPASEGLLNGATPTAPALTGSTTPATPGAPAASVPATPAAFAMTAAGGGK